MSVTAMKWVFEHSQTRGSARVLMLALADMANDDGECYPGKANLARKVNVTPQQITRLIQECERLGELKVIPRKGAHGSTHNTTNLYQLTAVCKQVSDRARVARPKRERKPAAPVVSDGILVSPAILPGSVTGDTTLVSPAIPESKDNPKDKPKDSDANASSAPTTEKPKRERKPKVQKERERNLIFDAVAQHIYGVDPLKVKNGGQIGPSAAVFKQHNVTDPEVVRQFVEWWKQKYPHADAPRNPDRLEVRLLEYLEHHSPAVASANGASSNWMREL